MTASSCSWHRALQTFYRSWIQDHSPNQTWKPASTGNDIIQNVNVDVAQMSIFSTFSLLHHPPALQFHLFTWRKNKTLHLVHHSAHSINIYYTWIAVMSSYILMLELDSELQQIDEENIKGKWTLLFLCRLFPRLLTGRWSIFWISLSFCRPLNFFNEKCVEIQKHTDLNCSVCNNIKSLCQIF